MRKDTMTTQIDDNAFETNGDYPDAAVPTTRLTLWLIAAAVPGVLAADYAARHGIDRAAFGALALAVPLCLMAGVADYLRAERNARQEAQEARLEAIESSENVLARRTPFATVRDVMAVGIAACIAASLLACRGVRGAEATWYGASGIHANGLTSAQNVRKYGRVCAYNHAPLGTRIEASRGGRRVMFVVTDRIGAHSDFDIYSLKSFNLLAGRDGRRVGRLHGIRLRVVGRVKAGRLTRAERFQRAVRAKGRRR